MIRAGVAIFAFNRAKSLERLLASLAQCPEVDDVAITIFIDGPRNERERDLVDLTRQVAISAQFKCVEIIQSEVNRGLRRSIYSGVSEVCSKYGRAIVLEDDLVLSPHALNYFLDGLDRYEGNARIWSICGYTYESSLLNGVSRAFFLPFAHPWGWATWARAWEKFEFDQPLAPKELLDNPDFRKSFDVSGLSLATDLLDLAQRGKVDSWFIRWYWKIFREGGLSLFPSKRFVVNKGVAEGGTHASALNPYRILVGDPTPSAVMPISWPIETMPDFEALRSMKRGRDASAQRFIAWAGRIKRLYVKK